MLLEWKSFKGLAIIQGDSDGVSELSSDKQWRSSSDDIHDDGQPLAFLTVDRPELSLNDTIIAHDAHERMETARRMCDRRHDVKLRREVTADTHDGRAILAQVSVREQRGQCAPERLVVGQYVSLRRSSRCAWYASKQRLLHSKAFWCVLVPVEEEGGRVARKGGVVGSGLRGDRVVDELVKVLADHAAHEAVVVLEERVGKRRQARFMD